MNSYENCTKKMMSNDNTHIMEKKSFLISLTEKKIEEKC